MSNKTPTVRTEDGEEITINLESFRDLCAGKEAGLVMDRIFALQLLMQAGLVEKHSRPDGSADLSSPTPDNPYVRAFFRREVVH